MGLEDQGSLSIEKVVDISCPRGLAHIRWMRWKFCLEVGNVVRIRRLGIVGNSIDEKRVQKVVETTSWRCRVSRV